MKAQHSKLGWQSEYTAGEVRVHMGVLSVMTIETEHQFTCSCLGLLLMDYNLKVVLKK